MEICIKWNVCRICLEEESRSPDMQSIYDDAKLATHIFDCSGIELKASDNLPEKICKKCLLALKYAMKFRTTCRKSTEYLQSILLKTQSASTIFKSAKSTVEEVPFESIDFLDEEPQAEVENSNVSSELQYLLEDVDEVQVVETKANSSDEVQENDEIIYMSESDIKQEIEDAAEEEDLQSHSQSEPNDEFNSNEDTMTRTSDEEQKQPLALRSIKREPPRNPVEYICDVCGNHFQKRCLLTFHMKVHRNERNYPCDTRQSSNRLQNINIETGHHQDRSSTRRTIVNNNKRDRQRRYREQNREKLKQREAERRRRIQNLQNIARLSNSSKRKGLNDEEIITSPYLEKTQPSSSEGNEQSKKMNALQKKRERQRRYREQYRDKLRQREAERRRRLCNFNKNKC